MRKQRLKRMLHKAGRKVDWIDSHKLIVLSVFCFITAGLFGIATS